MNTEQSGTPVPGEGNPIATPTRDGFNPGYPEGSHANQIPKPPYSSADEQSSGALPGSSTGQPPMRPPLNPVAPPKDHYTLSKNTLGAVTEGRLPEIEVFQHINFNHILGDRDPMNDPENAWSFRTSFDIDFTGDPKDNNLSSFIIYAGYWQLYEGTGFQNPVGAVFGPGQYAVITDYGVGNDIITSIKCVSLERPYDKNVKFSW